MDHIAALASDLHIKGDSEMTVTLARARSTAPP